MGEKHIIIYSKKINREYLLFNVVMTCAFFGVSFLIAGGSIWFGILVTIILAPCLEWLEVEKIIKVKD